jgi:hypothetical protein
VAARTRASLKPISTPRIIRSAPHNRDIEEVGQVTGGRDSFARSRSNADYAFRGERGDPRGRKFGAGSVAASPR